MLVRVLGRGRAVTTAWMVAWGLAVVTGLTLLAVHENRPTELGRAPERWPVEALLARPNDRPTLLMFAHPRCPCTRASVAELARVVAEDGRAASVTVLFYRPAEEPVDWARSATWKAAEGIPGVRVVDDPDGASARVFGVASSGHVLVYDAGGRLRFSGGITRARGHEGDSIGGGAARACLLGQPAGATAAPVFGCPISDRAVAADRRSAASETGP